VAYIWHAGTKAGIVQDSLAACGFETRSQIIWAKNNFAIGRGHYHCKHEPCWYVVRKGSTASWVGDHSQTTLWQIDKNLKSETGHGTQKPVECMRRPIENNSSPGQAVYEPFSGSGTTIIAAEITGRVAHAIEIAPAYIDVAVRRWAGFHRPASGARRRRSEFRRRQRRARALARGLCSLRCEAHGEQILAQFWNGCCCR
jgi:DNA modification methylase